MAREKGFRTMKVLCVLSTDPEALMPDLLRAAHAVQMTVPRATR
jgi:hypothetical protein